jgi:uncharacterized protein (DUF2225 family)
MVNGALRKKINAGSRVVFDDSGRFCLVLKGRINIVAPEKRQVVGPGGVIDSSSYAYAIENSELLFFEMEKLRKLKPELAARIADVMDAGSGASGKNKNDRFNGIKEEENTNCDSPLDRQGRTAYSYRVDVQCPVCEGHFKANKLFESKLKQLGSDNEMRMRFEDIEPIHYKVWVCPNCLYANFLNCWSDVSARQRSTLRASAEKRKSDFAALAGPDGEAERVINGYGLAIECLTQIKNVSNIIASAWLNLAWLYDDRDDLGRAAAARKNALEAYEEFYSQAQLLPPSSELQVLYIIGELNRRLGNIRKAHEHFLKVLHYKGHRMAILADLARDGLQELKQMAKEAASTGSGLTRGIASPAPVNHR